MKEKPPNPVYLHIIIPSKRYPTSRKSKIVKDQGSVHVQSTISGCKSKNSSLFFKKKLHFATPIHYPWRRIHRQVNELLVVLQGGSVSWQISKDSWTWKASLVLSYISLPYVLYSIKYIICMVLQLAVAWTWNISPVLVLMNMYIIIYAGRYKWS